MLKLLCGCGSESSWLKVISFLYALRWYYKYWVNKIFCAFIQTDADTGLQQNKHNKFAAVWFSIAECMDHKLEICLYWGMSWSHNSSYNVTWCNVVVCLNFMFIREFSNSKCKVPKVVHMFPEVAVNFFLNIFSIVQESDFHRTVGINTGHVGTSNYVLEDADRKFLIDVIILMFVLLFKNCCFVSSFCIKCFAQNFIDAWKIELSNLLTPPYLHF